MTVKIVDINPPKEADIIARGLRNIADDIESGKLGFLTTAVVVVGHSWEKNDGVIGTRYATFGLGPRHDAFTTRGLLATAISDLNGNID